MKKLLTYKRIYLLGLLPISLLLTIVAKKSTSFAEQIFAKHIYKWISQVISSISGLLPFSLTEILVLALPVVLLIIVLRFILQIILAKNKRGELLIKGFLNVACTGSMVLFLFTILAGLNYYRYPFSSYSDLELTQSTIEELYALTESLTIEANELRLITPKTDEEGVFQLSMSNAELAKLAAAAYELLSEDFPILAGNYGAPKPILLSKLMSQTEITGIFFPFTMEANVNVDVPDYSIPATMLHELAHLRGFMKEDEANFLAYLAGMKSDQVELQYSATMLALIISGNALYDQSPNLYFEVRSQYSEGVIKDIRANSEYWLQFKDTVVSTISNKVNDTYLKANSQADGVQSYGRMLDLLLAKFRKEHGDSVVLLSDNTEEQALFHDTSFPIGYEGTIFYVGEQQYNLTDRDISVNAINNVYTMNDEIIVVEGHIGPKNNYYGIFNILQKEFIKEIYGCNLIWWKDNPDSILYNFWNKVYDITGKVLYTAELADSLYIYDLVYAEDGKSFSVFVNDDTKEELSEIKVMIE